MQCISSVNVVNIPRRAKHGFSTRTNNRAHTRRGSFHLRYARLGVDGRFLGDLGAHDAHPVVGDVGRDEGDEVALELLRVFDVSTVTFQSGFS